MTDKGRVTLEWQVKQSKRIKHLEKEVHRLQARIINLRGAVARDVNMTQDDFNHFLSVEFPPDVAYGYAMAINEMTAKLISSGVIEPE